MITSKRRTEMNKVSRLTMVLGLVSLTAISACTSGPIAVKVGKMKNNGAVIVGNDKLAKSFFDKVFSSSKKTSKDEEEDEDDSEE